MTAAAEAIAASEPRPRPAYPSSWAARRARAAVLATLPNLPLALCATSDLGPEAWHPERGHREGEDAARALCQKCPERMECLGFALRAHPLYGMWGGMSEEQRDAMVSKREHLAFVRP